jgi:uncharacterized protein (TIGR00375 family)
MKELFADLHIHIGSSLSGKPVKITASKGMTVDRIMDTALNRKGLGLIGLVDCGSFEVQKDLDVLLEAGVLESLENGGLLYYNNLTVLLASEIEIGVLNGSAHFLCYFPYLNNIKNFSKSISEYITNINLSTQRCRLNLEQLFERVESYNGVVIPAHVFTPHKSLYGSCTESLKDFMPDIYDRIPSVELGLSSDTYLGDHIRELHSKSYLSNSDAHSIGKIAREYNQLLMDDISYYSLLKTLKAKGRNAILANYGMDPRLGKYHRTFCDKCKWTADLKDPTLICGNCNSRNVTMGVWDRLKTIGIEEPFKNRPPYYHSIPLEFIPGLGNKSIEKLLKKYDTELNIIHKSNMEDLIPLVGEKIADMIIRSKDSKGVNFISGGGGTYGKVK